MVGYCYSYFFVELVCPIHFFRQIQKLFFVAENFYFMKTVNLPV